MKNKKLANNLMILGALVLSSSALIGCKESDAFDMSKTINNYTRDTSSGTRDGFFTGIGYEDAKSDDTLLRSPKLVDDNGAMITSIKNDEYGIGYISLSSLNGSGVKGLSYNGVEPTEENVINKTYTLTRNFNWCIRSSYSNPDTSELVKAFLAYMKSKEGQTIIKDEGGIITNDFATESWVELKSQFSVLNKTGLNIIVKLGGSTSVKGIVMELVTEFNQKISSTSAKFEYKGTGSSDAYKGITAQDLSSNYLDLGFTSREFNAQEELLENKKGKMCTDAIVAVVNKANSFSNVTANQLKDIYAVDGKITKWSDFN